MWQGLGTSREILGLSRGAKEAPRTFCGSYLLTSGKSFVPRSGFLNIEMKVMANFRELQGLVKQSGRCGSSKNPTAAHLPPEPPAEGAVLQGLPWPCGF